MKKYTKNSLIFIMLISTIILVGCKPKKNSRQGRNPNKSIQTEEIKVKNIQPETIQSKINISGILEGINDINLLSQVNGRIISVNKKLGDSVKKGEKIATIDNIDLQLKVEQAEANVLASEANLDSQKIKFQSSEKLYKNGSISETEHILAKSQFKTAKANYNGAVANLKISQRNLAESKFAAPISGKIVSIDIEVGDFISSGKAVCGIVNNSKMKMQIGVGENSISKIKKGEKIPLTVKSTKETLVGIISGIGEKPSQDNFNYPVEIIIENPENAFVGQLVSGKIEVNSYQDVIAVENDYIHSLYGESYVYTLSSNNEIQKSSIKILQKINNISIIETGLKKGDNLIISKSRTLKVGEKIQSTQVVFQNQNSREV